MRRKVRKKLNAGERVQKPSVPGPNQRWSMDFMSDQLASGQRFRVLNVVDDFTLENVGMHIGTSITGTDVVRLLDTVLAKRAQPAAIFTDNGVMLQEILPKSPAPLRGSGTLEGKYGEATEKLADGHQGADRP
ncbi:DDE-type integrase/transposase/recombinase, partial [Deinococcus terrestris]|uniref:DDE-type integrase/transposase/recombinase n=1 Tax=Deinococcus terrestris TaxID=2651870 RepID=UPI001884238E